MEKVDWISKIRTIFKNASHVGRSGEIGVEEGMKNTN
jgi:hypothetical protein